MPSGTAGAARAGQAPPTLDERRAGFASAGRAAGSDGARLVRLPDPPTAPGTTKDAGFRGPASVLAASGGPCAWRESAGIQVDAHRQRAGAHRRGGAHAEPAREIAPADKPLPLARVVLVEDVRRSGPPADPGLAAHPYPDPRIRRDVPNP